MPDLSVVLPCYNESGNLPEILARYGALKSKLDLELILVDNGSTDQTPHVLAEALRRPENRFAKAVTVPQNVGYGHGLRAGLKEARAEVLAISHADLQCDPEDLGHALVLYGRTVASGPCLIKGYRQGKRPAADRAVTWCLNRLAALLLGLATSDSRPPDVNAQPKLFPRAWLEEILAGPDGFTFHVYVLHVARRRGAKIVEFPTAYSARQWGHSKLAANPWVRLLTSIKALCFMIHLRLCSK